MVFVFSILNIGLRNCQENAEVDVASLSSFCDSAESMLGGRRTVPDGDVIEMKRQSEEYVDTIRAFEDGTTHPPNVKQIQVSLECPHLSSTINAFGDLIITGGIRHNQRRSHGQGHEQRHNNNDNVSADIGQELESEEIYYTPSSPIEYTQSRSRMRASVPPSSSRSTTGVSLPIVRSTALRGRMPPQRTQRATSVLTAGTHPLRTSIPHRVLYNTLDSSGTSCIDEESDNYNNPTPSQNPSTSMLVVGEGGSASTSPRILRRQGGNEDRSQV